MCCTQQITAVIKPHSNPIKDLRCTKRTIQAHFSSLLNYGLLIIIIICSSQYDKRHTAHITETERCKINSTFQFIQRRMTTSYISNICIYVEHWIITSHHFNPHFLCFWCCNLNFICSCAMKTIENYYNSINILMCMQQNMRLMMDRYF